MRKTLQVIVLGIADLPPEFNLQVREGQLVGVNAEGCVSLVPLTPTRFAIPDNRGLTLDFALAGERVESLTLWAGELAAVYEPELPPQEQDVGALFQDVRAEIERKVSEDEVASIPGWTCSERSPMRGMDRRSPPTRSTRPAREASMAAPRTVVQARVPTWPGAQLPR